MSNKHQFKMGRKSALAIGAALALWTVTWPAAMPVRSDATTMPSDQMSVTDPKDGDTIVLEPGGKGKEVTFELKVHQANILNPDIADVHPLGTNELLVTGKKTGSTQMIITDETDHASVLNLEVSSPIERLRKQLRAVFPGSEVVVEDNNGTIMLTGQVHDLVTAEEITELASPYGKVLNLLEVGGGQQVMLKVKFAEVSKQAEQQLGFNFGGTDGVSFVGIGSEVGKNAMSLAPGATLAGNAITAPTGLATAAFGQGGFDKILFDYFVDALEQNSLVRTLAEPTLVTTSGQEATFLAGGSFPYPVPQTGTGGGSTITIQFQDYGVNLKFTPIVLGNGRIRLKVAPEVSELDFANTVTLDGTVVPGLTKRNVNTTVELSEGQTFALAGLLQDTITASNNSMPLLGQIPILGALFRSVQYQKNETELVVLVTPVLVHGIDPGDVTPVPGEKWRDPRPDQLYLLGDLGGEQPTPAPHWAIGDESGGQAPAFEGPAGFTPPK